MKMYKLSAKRRRFIEVYYTEAEGIASKAAALAGFGCPRSVGPKLSKDLAHLLEEKRLEIATASQVSAKETLELLATVARNGSHKDHLRALELMLKVHGLLSDKLQVTVDRKQLLSELDGQLVRLGVDGPKALTS